MNLTQLTQLTQLTRLGAELPHEIGHGFAGILGRLRAWAAGRKEGFATRRRLSREMQQLYRFSDIELRDVGLTRGDFLAIESGTYRRDRGARRG